MVISFTSFLINDVETAFHSLPFPSIPFFSLPFPSLLLSSLPFSSLSFPSLHFPSLLLSSLPHLTLWISDSRMTGFQFLSVELGFCISIVSGISDSLGCIPDSKAQDFGFLQLYSGFQSAGFRIPQAQNFPDSGIRIPLHGPLQDLSGMISVIVALKACICCGSILSLV